MSNKEKLSTIDKNMWVHSAIINDEPFKAVEDVKIKSAKSNKTDYKIESYKVLLVKHDGVVIDFNGNGIFIKTSEKTPVGSLLKIKYKGVLGQSSFELV